MSRCSSLIVVCFILPSVFGFSILPRRCPGFLGRCRLAPSPSFVLGFRENLPSQRQKVVRFVGSTDNAHRTDKETETQEVYDEVEVEQDDTKAVDQDAPSEEGEAKEESAEKEETKEKEKDPNEDLKEQIAKLEKEVNMMEAKLLDAKEQTKKMGKTGYYFLAAEVENYKRISQSGQDAIGYKVFADVLREIYPVMEPFKDAESKVPATTELGDKIHKSYRGLHTQFVETATKIGATSFHAVVGEPYSAYYHEEVERVPSGDYKENVIVQEVEEGLELKGNVIRKAKCIVSSGKPAEEGQESDNAKQSESEESTE